VRREREGGYEGGSRSVGIRAGKKGKKVGVERGEEKMGKEGRERRVERWDGGRKRGKEMRKRMEEGGVEGGRGEKRCGD
jgi:hypothetical protein